MERLASIILENLSLYKECHHCKRINLATNTCCHTCMLPQLDPLSDKTIQRVERLSDEGETIPIANI